MHTDGLNQIQNIHFSKFSNDEPYFVDSYFGYVNVWHLIPRYLQTCYSNVVENVKSNTECSIRGLEKHNCLAFIFIKDSQSCKLCLNTSELTSGMESFASLMDLPFIVLGRFRDFVDQGKICSDIMHYMLCRRCCIS